LERYKCKPRGIETYWPGLGTRDATTQYTETTDHTEFLVYCPWSFCPYSVYSEYSVVEALVSGLWPRVYARSFVFDNRDGARHHVAMKPELDRTQSRSARHYLCKALLLAAVCGATLVCHAQAQPQFQLPFNEGAGNTITDSAGGLTGPLGIYLDPVEDVAFIANDYAPAGVSGDHSLQFQGTGYLLADDSANKILNITNGPITIEAWVYLTSPSPGSTLWECVARYGASYKLGMRGRNLAFTLLGKADIFSGRILPAYEWVHVAAVWNPGAGVTFYTNGVGNTVNNAQTSARPVFDNYLGIGFEGPSPSTTPQKFPGFMDRLRIHHAALTVGQIDSDPVNPKPVYPETLVAYNFNHANLPAQNSAATLLPAGLPHAILPGWTSPTWTSDTPGGQPGDYALEFAALSSGGVIPQSATVLDPSSTIAMNPANGDYTLEAWIKLPSTFPSNTRRIIYQYQGTPGFALSLNTDRTLHTTAFGKVDQVSSALVPNDEAWHHVAVVHQDGLEFRFYVDGVLGDTRAYALGFGSGTLPRFTIGSAFNGALPFVGKMDRLRFTNQALTPEQFDFPAGPVVPALAIGRQGNSLVITWEASATGFILERAGSLGGSDWSTISHEEVGGVNTATVQPSGAAGFYRLRKP
jgi:hypothetical protein